MMDQQATIEKVLVQNKMIIQDSQTAKVSAELRTLQARHTCPVCGQSSSCFSIGDKYHSCGLCGSVWREQGPY